MQADLYTAIYDTLKDSGASFADDLGASTVIAGGKAIHLVEAPDEEQGYPLAIIVGVSDTLGKYLADASDDVDLAFQIDLYVDAEDSDTDAILALNDKLVALLDESAVTVTNHAGAQFQLTERGTVSRELDAYRITSQWRLIATVAA